MKVMVIISFIILIGYLIHAIHYFKKVPPSISDTFYRLRYPWTFTLSMIAAGSLLMPAMIEFTPDPFRMIPFFGCVGIALVGVSPNFKSNQGLERTIHYTGAIALLMTSILWVGMLRPWVLSLWVVLVISMITTYIVERYDSWKKLNLLFWIEVTAIISTYLTLFCV